MLNVGFLQVLHKFCRNMVSDNNMVNYNKNMNSAAFLLVNDRVTNRTVTQ